MSIELQYTTQSELIRQYEDGTCVRCKAGGWKCIRTRAEVERKGSSNSCGQGGLDTLDEEYDETPTPSGRTMSADPLSFTDTYQMSADSSNSITPAQISLPATDGDLNMTDDPTLSWLNMDLASLLSQSLPPLDMSQYQSMGDLAPIHSDTVPFGQDGSYSFDLQELSSSAYSQPIPNTKPTHVPPQAIQYAPLTPQIQLVLREFCKSRFTLLPPTYARLTGRRPLYRSNLGSDISSRHQRDHGRTTQPRHKHASSQSQMQGGRRSSM